MSLFGNGGGPVLPVYASDLNGSGAHKDKRVSPLAAVVKTAQSFVRTVVHSKSTRNVFFYLLINVSFASVEVVYGLITNSLGLIGDGVHMYFDSSAIFFGLVASYIAKWAANDRFSYGYTCRRLSQGRRQGRAAHDARCRGGPRATRAATAAWRHSRAL